VRPAVGTDEWCELPDVREAVVATSRVMTKALRDAGIQVDAPRWKLAQPRPVNLREQITEDLQAEIDHARNAWMAEKV